jgi:hypothetical protein
VLHLKLKHDPQNETDLDLGATGPSIGDRFIFSADVFRGDDRVGVAGGDCVTVRFRGTATQPQAFIDLCTASLSLRQGQITAQALIDRLGGGPGPLALAITGGTGAYRTAHGQIETSGPNQAGIEPLTVRLILSD